MGPTLVQWVLLIKTEKNRKEKYGVSRQTSLKGWRSEKHERDDVGQLRQSDTPPTSRLLTSYPKVYKAGHARSNIRDFTWDAVA